MLTIKADVGQLSDQLRSLSRQQLPFATALALTDTANLAKTAITRALPSIFDRPTPFTMNAVSVQRATKRRLEARVFVKERQATYLAIEETGGTAIPKKQAFVMPRAIGVDRYGNMPKGAIKRAIARKGVFSGQVDGVNGLFFRKEKDKPPVLLALFTKRATYKPTFGFKARVLKVAGATLPIAMKASMAKALATARR